MHIPLFKESYLLHHRTSKSQKKHNITFLYTTTRGLIFQNASIDSTDPTTNRTLIQSKSTHQPHQCRSRSGPTRQTSPMSLTGCLVQLVFLLSMGPFLNKNFKLMSSEYATPSLLENVELIASYHRAT